MSVFPVRGLALAGLLGIAAGAGAQDGHAGRGPGAGMLVTTISDLDSDHLDFLTGWRRGDGDILEIASRGIARFALVPLVPSLTPAARFRRGWRPGARSERFGRARARVPGAARRGGARAVPDSRRVRRAPPPRRPALLPGGTPRTGHPARLPAPLVSRVARSRPRDHR